jgi:hypothetical protein
MQKKLPLVKHSLSENSAIIEVKGNYIAADFEAQLVLISGKERVYHPCFTTDGFLNPACPAETLYYNGKTINIPSSPIEGAIIFIPFIDDSGQLRLPKKGELVTEGQIELKDGDVRYEMTIRKYLSHEVMSSKEMKFKKLALTPLSVVDLNPILIDTWNGTDQKKGWHTVELYMLYTYGDGQVKSTLMAYWRNAYTEPRQLRWEEHRKMWYTGHREFEFNPYTGGATVEGKLLKMK